MKHLRRNLRAISPVLAVLMMIAVAIAGSLVVYAWVMGYIDLSTEKSGQQLTIQSVANDVTDTDLLVYVQNVGEGLAQLDERGCLYINGELVVCEISGVAVSDHIATLNQGETATLTVIDGAALPGVKYDVKVTAVLGTPAEKTSYPAGKARAAPVLDHFEFATIDSPQISDVAFSITIVAMDQYDAPYTEYTSTNNLEYSGGDITPAVTGGFVAGEWTGNVTVTGTADDAVISTAAAFDETYVGVSDPFDVDAAVTFVSCGDGGLTTTVGDVVDYAPTYPSDLEEGDLILLQVGVRDTTNVPDTPSGFTLLYGPVSSGYGRQWIYYKLSTGNETGSLTISVPGSPTNVASQMSAFRYVKTVSFATSESFAEDEESDIIYAESVVGVGERTLALNFVYATDNQLIDSFTGETGGNWLVQAFKAADAGSSQEDAYIVMQTAKMLTGGTISGGSYTREGVYPGTGGNSWCIIAFALIPID